MYFKHQISCTCVQASFHPPIPLPRRQVEYDFAVYACRGIVSTAGGREIKHKLNTLEKRSRAAFNIDNPNWPATKYYSFTCTRHQDWRIIQCGLEVLFFQSLSPSIQPSSSPSSIPSISPYSLPSLMPPLHPSTKPKITDYIVHHHPHHHQIDHQQLHQSVLQYNHQHDHHQHYHHYHHLHNLHLHHHLYLQDLHILYHLYILQLKQQLQIILVNHHHYQIDHQRLHQSVLHWGQLLHGYIAKELLLTYKNSGLISTIAFLW